MKNHLRHLLFLAQSLLLAMLFFSLSRLVFFLYTSDLFPQIFEDGIISAFIHGMRFDLSAIAYLNIPFILLLVFPSKIRQHSSYQKTLKFLFLSLNGLGLFLNLSDIVNVGFTGKRMTADVFSFLGQGTDAQNVVLDFLIDNWSIFVVFILLFWLLYKCFSFLQNNQFFLYRSKLNWSAWLYTILVLGLTVLTMRGGTQLRPIKNIHASYFGNGKYVPLILNSPFSILSTINDKQLKEKNYYTTEAQKLIFDAEQNFEADSLKNKNVVILILESFSREYIGAYNSFEGYTPFLDSLMSRSIVCQHAYANGKKSIEGIPAIISGIPALMDKPYILSQYGSQKGNSIASILQKQGYDCSFYHGGNPGTMGFDAYAEIADFHSYKDLSYYNGPDEHYDGKWGIYDEHFLGFFEQELSAKSQPFFSSFFSLSSHHPYSIPDEHQGKFKTGELKIHETVGYADYALKRFFEKAQRSDWYENTIFIITADHTFKASNDEYKNKNGLYAIPLILYSPSDSLAYSVDKVCQQADILPSLIDYLQIDTSIVCFGNSIFSEEGYAVNYLNNVYQYISEGYLLQFNGEKSLGLYHVDQDSLMLNNLVEIEIERVHTYETKLKAYIQEYNYRMINNKLKCHE